MALIVNVKVGAELLATRCCLNSGVPRLSVLAGSGHRVAPLDGGNTFSSLARP
jgi:hypothetical protein